jgi:hypothetical protein
VTYLRFSRSVLCLIVHVHIRSLPGLTSIQSQISTWSLIPLPCSSVNLATGNQGRTSLLTARLNRSTGPFLSRENAVPLGQKFPAQSQPRRTKNQSSPRAGPLTGPYGRTSCSRCLSNFHSRPNNFLSTRCTSFFHLGHIATSCRFPPRFSGLSKDKIFSCHLRSATWDQAHMATWFRKSGSMTSGAVVDNPLVLTPASSTSIPLTLPTPSFLATSAQPSFPDAAIHRPSVLVLPELQLCTPCPEPPPHSQPPPSPKVPRPSGSPRAWQDNPTSATVPRRG